MSRSLLGVLDEKIDSCVEEARKKENFVLLDDVLIGICVHRETGLGCWDRSNYRYNAVFAHEEGGFDSYSDEALRELITLHAFKKPGMMAQQHQRFLKANNLS